ncbi:ribosomal L7Ae/L30e/S12e/Gadd45 family protein [Candidatus Woesearchaeota archaeon]|nr:ribosomal L7Ae/L30e/S12e/Gadd45 family protein [Candidatus Woesearchaeota archaeon]
MAKKKEAVEEIRDLKAKLTEGKTIIGTQRVLKALKSKSVKTVYLAKNCPDKIKDDIAYYAQLAQTPIITLEQDNEELGTLCKKNFFVCVLASTEE